jgi:threonine/homoserine/homoserine lactone efflux protein
MLENLISFSIASFALAFSPGPDNIYVITQSLVNGIKSGIATTAGLVSGCIVHTTFLAFGISAVITTSYVFLMIIKICGAIYLLFLSYKVLISDSRINLPVSEVNNKRSYFDLFKKGVIMNLINPKVMIFFLAFFPGFLWNETENTVSQFYILGLTFMLISFLVFSGLSFLAGSISRFTLKHQLVGVILKWLQILVFVGIAIFILLP